jgi:hypothetical protein
MVVGHTQVMQFNFLISEMVELQNVGLINSRKARLDCFDLPLK